MEKLKLKLYEMCQNKDFNIEEAKDLISMINLNEPFRKPCFNSETFFLHTAVFYQNIRMVELLLQNGADPNLIVDSECALWDLQYNIYVEKYYEKNPEVALV